MGAETAAFLSQVDLVYPLWDVGASNQPALLNEFVQRRVEKLRAILLLVRFLDNLTQLCIRRLTTAKQQAHDFTLVWRQAQEIQRTHALRWCV